MTLVPPNTRPNSILALTPLGRCPILQIRTLKCKWGYVTDFRSFVPHKVLVTHPGRVGQWTSQRSGLQHSLSLPGVCEDPAHDKPGRGSHLQPRPSASCHWALAHLPCGSVITHSTLPRERCQGLPSCTLQAGLAGFQLTAGQDGVCGRLQGAQLDAWQRIF